jgi:hypothetical protein
MDLDICLNEVIIFSDKNARNEPSIHAELSLAFAFEHPLLLVHLVGGKLINFLTNNS